MMDEQSGELGRSSKPQVGEEGDAILDFWEAFDRAWCAIAEGGGCDYKGGVEYGRVAREAWEARVPLSQVDLRRFIRVRANVGPVPSVTQCSLSKRRVRAERARKDGDHDR